MHFYSKTKKGRIFKPRLVKYYKIVMSKTAFFEKSDHNPLIIAGGP